MSAEKIKNYFIRLNFLYRRERKILVEKETKEAIEMLNQAISILGYEEHLINGRHIISKKLF